MLFHIVLDRRVERRDEAAAVIAGAVLLIAAQEHLTTVGVGGAKAPAGGAGEGLVIARLDPLEPVVVRADEAEEVAGEPAVRVIALAVRLEPDAADLVFGLEAPDLGRLVRLDLAGDRDIPAPPAPGFLIHVRIVEIQDLREGARDERPVLAVRLDLGGTEIDIVHRGADREDVSAAVIDRAAQGAAGGLPELLGDGEVFVKAVVCDLNVIQPREQHGCRAHAENRREHRAPPEHLPPDGHAGLGYVGHMLRLRS